MSEARELATTWRASGETQAAWCRSHGIAKWTLKACLALVRVLGSDLSRARAVGAVSGFVAVHPPAVAMEAACEVRIELGGGAQVVGLDLAGVIAVVLGLRESERAR